MFPVFKEVGLLKNCTAASSSRPGDPVGADFSYIPEPSTVLTTVPPLGMGLGVRKGSLSIPSKIYIYRGDVR